MRREEGGMCEKLCVDIYFTIVKTQLLLVNKLVHSKEKVCYLYQR
jgi:hypothetical protein